MIAPPEPRQAARPEHVFNIPNLLTLSRLALAWVVFALVGAQWYWAALIVFAIAAITDAFDGYVARRLGQGTVLGRQLDPLVDKVLICGVFIFLMSVRADTGLGPWIVSTIVIRELLIQGLRSHLEGGGQAFGAQMAGKLKTVVQCLSISAILMSLSLRPTAPWLLARDVVTWTAVALTVYSGLGYVMLAIPRFRDRSPSTLP
ncbi:CDP-diacylglycerol--glycerol-3-phosphate 3-phosphatidyltransferase [Tundrisphaera sp. TA3]|uniref:CDP-diacylglycerol--glycerol-3-phosphate 3-phosphatidyltransferase n=1 Tax=Tundrisphaera sp. TA3 TaxID=3435775 RepID=UPI003EBF5F0F